MHLLDHITVNDFIIASMLADNSKEAQEKLASRLNNIFGDDVAEGFFEGEEFNELVQQTISLIPVWLENGSVQKQTWSMQGVYFEPEQSFDTGAVEVYQLTQQTSDSEKNKAFRFSAYLNGLFEGNGEVFDPDNFKVESEQPVIKGFVVVETLTQQFFNIKDCETEDDAFERVIKALGEDGVIVSKNELWASPFSDVTAL